MNDEFDDLSTPRVEWPPTARSARGFSDANFVLTPSLGFATSRSNSITTAEFTVSMAEACL